ncbi:von Willebrand factor D and EGF domain-containing protein-like [Ostrea edulis]|uniref:von Willebrand factor D and EGF domain-containing protein-like n=1 Tax=Ostrea edulis TaxID=37623 RepID=UPI0024AFDE80|nr:von Willebrand factor D and EGF domain-containing protein-like [Ostrea edulis]
MTVRFLNSLTILITIMSSAKGNHLSISAIGCHVFTTYTIPDDQVCLTRTDLGRMTSFPVYTNDDLKLESSDGSPVLLSTTPCTCSGSGSLYIDDTMPAVHAQKFVSLHPSGMLGTFNCGNFYLLSIKYLDHYMNRNNADFCLDVDVTCKVLNASGTNIDSSLKSCAEVQPVSMESKDGTQLEPVFLCIFPPISDDVVYDVSWFINDEELTWAASHTVQYADVNLTALRPSNWTGNYSLNFEVACAVKAYKKSSSISGPTYMSPKFFAGIKPEHRSYYVAEGVTSQIALTSTIPFSCPLFLSEEMREAFCTYYFYIWTPAEDSCRNGMSGNGLAMTNQPCGVTFKFNDWGNKSVYINVTGYMDGMINYNDRTTLLHIESTKNPMDALGIWNNLKFDGIEVSVGDQDNTVTGRQCISSNDPHMTTFDGFRWENQRTGIFTLYQHKTLPYTVHVIYSECVPRRATCNCGVAVRNGFSFYIVRTCEMISLVNTKMLSVPYEKEHLCDTTDLGILKLGRHYTLTFPTGTQVIFDISYWNPFIGSVRIRASVADIESSVGLCGYSNGDTSDDFIPKDGNNPTDSATFALSWRIPMNSNDSLFSKNSTILQDTTWKYNTNSPSQAGKTYCICAQSGPVNSYEFVLSNSVHCNMTSPSQLCKNDNSVVTVDSCASSNSRRKRSLDDTDNVALDSVLTYDHDYNESAVIEVGQWANNWNETSAKEFCLQQFDLDPAVDVCNRLVNISKEPFLDDCVADIKLSGNASFVEDTLTTLKGACLTEATRNEVFYVNQSSDTNGLSIFEFISTFLCPRNCSGNGVCVNATCSCSDGYLGSDCSGKLSVPPKDFLLPSSGLCDLSSRQCRTTNIMGYFDSEKVIAKFAYFKVKPAEIQDSAYVKTENSTSHHFNLISVQIPKPPGTNRRRRDTGADQTIHGWNISLSYDGNTYSNHVTFLIFDGLMYTCDVQTLICYSSKSASLKSSVDSDTSVLTIAVGVTAILLLVITLPIIVICTMKKIGGRRKSVGINVPIQSVLDLKPSPARNQQEGSMLPADSDNTKSPLPQRKEMEFCGSQNMDFFWVPSPYLKSNVPPLNHRMTSREDKEHNSISIISFDD